MNRPAAIAKHRAAAQEANTRAGFLAQEADEARTDLDRLILAGEPTTEARARLAGIQDRHREAQAEERAHRTTADRLTDEQDRAAAVSLVEQAQVQVDALVAQHPVPN